MSQPFQSIAIGQIFYDWRGRQWTKTDTFTSHKAIFNAIYEAQDYKQKAQFLPDNLVTTDKDESKTPEFRKGVQPCP